MYVKHTSVGTILLPHHPLHRYLIASWLAQFHPKPPPAICNVPLLDEITKLQSLGFQEDKKNAVVVLVLILQMITINHSSCEP